MQTIWASFNISRLQKRQQKNQKVCKNKRYLSQNLSKLTKKDDKYRLKNWFFYEKEKNKIN